MFLKQAQKSLNIWATSSRNFITKYFQKFAQSGHPDGNHHPCGQSFFKAHSHSYGFFRVTNAHGPTLMAFTGVINAPLPV